MAPKEKLSGTAKRLKTLAEETRKNKERFLEQLRKHPVVEVACRQSSVGRSTVYKWLDEDEEFTESFTMAKTQGKIFMCDMTESLLIKAASEGNMTAIIFFLKNNHPDYADKVRFIHNHHHTHHVHRSNVSEDDIEKLSKLALKETLKMNGQEMTDEEFEEYLRNRKKKMDDDRERRDQIMREMYKDEIPKGSMEE